VARINTGGPAFPRAGSEDRSMGDMPDGNGYDKPEDGMTLRDWFAGMAMQGICSANPVTSDVEVSRFAYAMADRMLAARESI
jgi:hypothetical protein